MSLDSRVVRVDGAQKRVKGHITDVLVTVEQETAEDVDGQDPQAGLGADVHDGEYSLVQDRISDIFGRFRVGRHLGQDVVHSLGCLGIAVAQYSQQPQNLYL